MAHSFILWPELKAKIPGICFICKSQTCKFWIRFFKLNFDGKCNKLYFVTCKIAISYVEKGLWNRPPVVNLIKHFTIVIYNSRVLTTKLPILRL